MRAIWKFELPAQDLCDVEMPKGAAVIAVQVQRTRPCVWATIDTDAEYCLRRFRIYGTGNAMDDAGKFPHYVGTFQLFEGELVYHVFTDRIERDIPLRRLPDE